MMTDSAKNIVWEAAFTPFGQPHAITGSATHDARFPGQWFQLESGLACNWHRHYDPTTGRYTQPDPLGFVDGPGVFGYARGNPIGKIDPEGLATYMCQRPLDALGGEGRRSGWDVWGNILYHQFICLKVGKKTICGGQNYGQSILPWRTPGVPSKDEYNPEQCSKEEPDDICIEKCVLQKINGPRPRYGLFGPGTNCQEWARDTLSQCRQQCVSKN